MKSTGYRLLLVAVGLAGVTILFIGWKYAQTRNADVASQPIKDQDQRPDIDRSVESDLDSVIPSSVLESLALKFVDIQQTMHEDEVLSVLRLDNFKSYLENNYRFQMTGGGGNRKTYLLDVSGYELEFYDFLGHDPKCTLHVPGKRGIATARIGQSVTEMVDLNKYLNAGN